MKLKRAYDMGGTMSIIGAMQSMGTGLVDAIDPDDEYGKKGLLGTLYKGNLQGGTIGMVSALIGRRRAMQAERQDKAQLAERKKQFAMNRYSAEAAANPDLASGTAGGGYFETGGKLFTSFMNRKLKGGSLSRLSSDTVEVKGNSHKQGGVTLPTGEEVERDETIKGDYVLSAKLGFAQAHKPIAKAIGILERKAPSTSVLNSLQRLRDKEQALILFQEQYRKQNNLE